ncbi:hypothetical protein [Streptomyces sp900116325]|uniref:hypothetical protein n=1 Tax=Streptomyces sp. 900116325 TaxID=3154295 RepID=UPI0033183972
MLNRKRCCRRDGSSKPGARHKDALDADGPDAGLYAVLGRSHAAEEADDEDDLATASPPAVFRGAQLLPDTPAGASLSNAMTAGWDIGDTEPFMYIYGTPGRARPEAMVFGAIGDFHDTSPDAVGFFEQGLRGITSTAGTARNADPGDDGRWLRCVAYTPVVDSGARQVACSWADKGSVGTVIVNEEGLDHESAAGLTRALRHAILHTGPVV